MDTKRFDKYTWPVVKQGLVRVGWYPTSGGGSHPIALLNAPTVVQEAVKEIWRDRGAVVAEVYQSVHDGEIRYYVFVSNSIHSPNKELVYPDSIAEVEWTCIRHAQRMAASNIVYVAWREPDRVALVLLVVLGAFLTLFFGALAGYSYWYKGDTLGAIVISSFVVLAMSFLLYPFGRGYVVRRTLRLGLRQFAPAL